jgi:cytochrome c peroxidase
MLRLRHIFLFTIALGTVNYCFASGMYIPRNNFKSKSSSEYAQGKALFFGKTQESSGQPCSSCHVDDNRLKRSKLNKIRNSLAASISNHPEHKSIKGDLSSKDIESISVYLKKRYQLR